MKIKYLVLIAVAGLGVAATLYAETLRPAKREYFLLRSHGQTVAELKVLATSKVKITGGTQFINSSQHVVLTGRKEQLTIEVSGAEGSPVTIKADEVEMAPGSTADLIASPN
jgi:hypothetical protein